MKSLWQIKKLGEICDFIFGFSFRADDFNDKGLGMPVIRTGDLNNLRNTEKFYTGPYKDEYLVEGGDVLIGLSGTIISGIWQGPRALLNQRVVKLTNFRNVEKKFIGYILPLPLKKLSEELTKSAVKNVLKNHLANLEIPLPPLPIQQKIVKILDTIQSAVEIQEKIIEKTKELKKSLMNLLFHYGLAGLRIKELASLRVGELLSSEIEKLGLKLKKTKIGEIPENWEVVRLGDKKIAEIKYGKGKPPEGGKIPVIGSSGIYDWTNKALIEKPTIIIGRKGTAGIPHLSMLPCWPSDTAFYLDLNLEKINPKFLYEYILFRPLSGEHAKTTLPSLKREDLETFKIPLPHFPEQQEIAEILQTIDQKIEIEKKKKELYEELFKTVLNKIMNQEIDINLLDC